MTINRSRPVEELVGPNRGIVRHRLGNIHCFSSLLTAARAARPRNMRAYPVQLRRGWAKCVIDTMNEYRALYRLVMGGGQ